MILPTAPGVSNEGRSSPLLVPLPLFLGPGFRLGARWNRLVEAVKTRKKREKTGKKWARYDLNNVNTGRDRRDQLAPSATPAANALQATVLTDHGFLDPDAYCARYCKASWSEHQVGPTLWRKDGGFLAARKEGLALKGSGYTAVGP